MKTNYLKNIFLVGSGIAIATSTAIFASNVEGVSIQANLVNLVQYLKELHITSDGTPNGDDILSVSHAEDGRGQVQANGYFNSTFASGDLTSTMGIGTEEDGLRGHFMSLHSGDITSMIGFDKASTQILTTIQAIDTTNGWGSVVSASNLGTRERYAVFDNYSNEIKVDNAGVTFSFEDNISNNTEHYTFPWQDGSANQVLKTNGNGQLSWTDVGAGGSSSYQALGMTEIQGAESLIHLDLSMVGTLVAELQVHYNDNLQSINLSHLTNAYGSEFYIGDNHGLTSLDLSSLDTTKKLIIYRNSLTNLDLSSLTYAGQISVTYGNSGSGYPVNDLTQIIIGNNLHCLNIDFSNNALTQGNIDDIVAKLDAAGYNNGTLNIGGTNGYPSVAGLASIANLESKERFVSYNTEPVPG